MSSAANGPRLSTVRVTRNPTLRVAPGPDGVAIWSPELFGAGDVSRLREFLARTFSVHEVHGVELQRRQDLGRIHFARAKDPAPILRKLGQVLRSLDEAPLGYEPRIDAGQVFIDARSQAPVRVSRIGAALSTWRVRHRGEGSLRLSHARLRNRRDIVFRLEEELGAILGIEDFRVSAITGGVSIRFDERALTAERLARELEKAWPRLLEGLDGPPSRVRLAASVGLVGLSFAGQYVVPALRPVAIAAATLYSAPNVVNAAKELKRGEIGLPALYSTGLAFMLASGNPFPASVFATLTQAWPQLARRRFVRSQRRLFAARRRRALSARVKQADGSELDVSVDALRPGDLVVVRGGELSPIDGVVQAGAAVVVDEAPLGGDGLEDRNEGDEVAAGAFVRDGQLTLRVERAGSATFASYVDSLLPHAAIPGMPCSLEAERVANRNAKPALALAAASFAATRTLRPSQALIRPDYATGPRLSAELSALHGVAEGLQRGVLFRNPAALDRLADVDVFVFDDSAGLDRRRVEVAAVQAVSGVTSEQIVGYALAAQRGSRSEQARALAAFASKRKIARLKIRTLARLSGLTRLRDRSSSAIEVATPGYLEAAKIDVPLRFQSARPKRSALAAPAAPGAIVPYRPSIQPLWVLRDGQVIGVVSFVRGGEVVGRQLVAALKAHSPKARIVLLSSGRDSEAQALARRVGIEFSRGDLRAANKVDFIRGLGQKTLWIGNGAEPEAREQIAASTVSVSVPALAQARQDAADVLLPQKGLAGLIDALEVARAHKARLDADYRTIYATNLLGAAGAFLARFGSIQSGLLSNAGTGVVYARNAWGLRRLASAADKRRARLRSVALR